VGIVRIWKIEKGAIFYVVYAKNINVGGMSFNNYLGIMFIYT